MFESSGRGGGGGRRRRRRTALLVDAATGTVLRLSISTRPSAPPHVPRIRAVSRGHTPGSVVITLSPSLGDGGSDDGAGSGGRGGCRLLGYVVCVQPGGYELSVDGAPARIVVKGLVPGRRYDFTVRAVSEAGSSARSVPSAKLLVGRGAGSRQAAGPAMLESEHGSATAPLSHSAQAEVARMVHNREAEVLHLVVLATVGGLALLLLGGTLLWRRVKRQSAVPAPRSFDQIAGYRQFQCDSALQSAGYGGGGGRDGGGYGAQQSASSRSAHGGGGRSTSPTTEHERRERGGGGYYSEGSSDEGDGQQSGVASRLSDDEDDVPVQRFAV